MKRALTCAGYLLGLLMTLSSFSLCIAKQSADFSILLIGTLGFIVLLNSFRDGLEGRMWGKFFISISSIAIACACAWLAASAHVPRALLVALPINLSISIVSVVLLFRH